jgi:hypothetical protein
MLEKAGTIPHACIEVIDAIDFTIISAKNFYNKKHKPLFFNKDDWVYLCLHKGYSILAITNHKLYQQQVGPFQVTECISHLIYKLQIPTYWYVHNVFSITHLELAPAPDTDPYKCLCLAEPPAITVNSEEE